MTDYTLRSASPEEINQINAIRAAAGQQQKKKFWWHDFLHRRWKVIFLRQDARRFAAMAVLSCIVVLTVSCAGLPGREVEHGFSIKNKGESPISQVVVRYGEVNVPFCTVQCYGGQGGGGWNAPMPVQKEMLVTWKTSDGQSHEARVQVKSRLESVNRISTLYLEFDDSKLFVIQGLRYDQPGLVGHEMHSLYP